MAGRYRGVLVPFTAGETLIDFRVQGESIVGSPHPVEMPMDPGNPGRGQWRQMVPCRWQISVDF